MASTCRPVSQQHWLAHGSARARAHPGWTIRVLARRTAAGYRRERRGQWTADVSLVSGGSEWSGRAPISRPGSTLARISVQTQLADDGGRENNPAGMRSPRVAVSLNESWRQAPGRRTRPLTDESAEARARGPVRTNYSAVVHTTPAIGVESNRSWPCGRDSHPKPECHQRRYLRHEARGVGYWF
jgi:hypothetical protein